MAILLPFFFLLSYFMVRKVWFTFKKVRTVATIEKIKLGLIGGKLVLPEVKIHYKYYFQSGLYFGSGYMELSEFLPEENYYFHVSQDGLPILFFQEDEIVSEEHIEQFFLGKASSVLIHVDPIEPYHSRIDSLNIPHFETVV